MKYLLSLWKVLRLNKKLKHFIPNMLIPLVLKRNEADISKCARILCCTFLDMYFFLTRILLTWRKWWAPNNACGRSPAEILGSNPTGGMDICLLWVSCVVRYRSVPRADHSSSGVLPTVVRRVWSRNIKNRCFIYIYIWH